jgi:hypothetical protein
MRRCMMTLALAATAAGGVSAQTLSPGGAEGDRAPPPPAASIRITPDNARVSRYLHELASPGALAGVVGGGLLERLRHEDRTNLAEQIASRATQRVAEVSVRHGLAAAMHQSTDDHFHFCKCRGFGPRVGHALAETFTQSRADGSRAFAVPRLAGSYAAGFAGLAWQHDRSIGSVVAGTTLSFGLQALFNIGRELGRCLPGAAFWPGGPPAGPATGVPFPRYVERRGPNRILAGAGWRRLVPALAALALLLRPPRRRHSYLSRLTGLFVADSARRRQSYLSRTAVYTPPTFPPVLSRQHSPNRTPRPEVPPTPPSR